MFPPRFTKFSRPLPAGSGLCFSAPQSSAPPRSKLPEKNGKTPKPARIAALETDGLDWPCVPSLENPSNKCGRTLKVDAPPANDPHAANVYAFGDFTLDVPARTLSRSGMGTVPLPSRAFDSLVYLVEHRERLVRKNELIDAVWHDVVVTDDSLIHAISVLRRALADDPSNCHYVQTIPRRGYRFIAPVRVIADPAAHLPPPVTPEAPSTDVRFRAPTAPPPARWSGRRGVLLGGVAVAAAATLALGIDALSSRREASLEEPSRERAPSRAPVPNTTSGRDHRVGRSAIPGRRIADLRRAR